MPQTFYQIWIHLVWATKNREPLLLRNKRTFIFQHIREQAIEKGYFLDIINGVDDHVHCLISLQPEYALSKVVNDLKGESSNWINNEKILNEHFEWQDGYGAFSVSNQKVGMVRKYILNQEVHHQQMSFEEEFSKMKKLSSISINQ